MYGRLNSHNKHSWVDCHTPNQLTMIYAVKMVDWLSYFASFPGSDQIDVCKDMWTGRQSFTIGRSLHVVLQLRATYTELMAYVERGLWRTQ